MAKYILGIDQSTQGTKALLFDEEGSLIGREDLPHKQIVNEKGFVSHNPCEVYENTIAVVKKLVEKVKIDKALITALGISNQRETTAIWNRETGLPLGNAIVWQCARGKDTKGYENAKAYAEDIKMATGLTLSPYFPASKMAWFLENVEEAKKLQEEGKLSLGTMDSWLIYKLTKGKTFATDYSNASRTEIFNINTLKWDEKIADIFGIKINSLPKVMSSNSHFGDTDFEGFLDKPIPILSAMGDSHAALFGQGGIEKAGIKATYGTGSSIMMNIGDKPIISKYGVVTSLGWGIDGKITYVLEGNINYTGAVITWLKEDLELIADAFETEELAKRAIQDDEVYLIPAFSGLGAPHWLNEAKARIVGMTRTTKKAEIVRAALECIAYQVTDVIRAMEKDAGLKVTDLKVDGGPTHNDYLMQFQSDIGRFDLQVPDTDELSGIGAAYMAGITAGLYDISVLGRLKRKRYLPKMDRALADKKYEGWTKAIGDIKGIS